MVEVDDASWPTAAVPYVRRKRVLEDSGSCRERQLTGLVANSRNRPILLKNSESQRHQVLIGQLRTVAVRAQMRPLDGALGPGADFRLGHVTWHAGGPP